MSGVEIRQKAASEGQRSSRRGPAPLYRASWSTVLTYNGQIYYSVLFAPYDLEVKVTDRNQ